MIFVVTIAALIAAILSHPARRIAKAVDSLLRMAKLLNCTPVQSASLVPFNYRTKIEQTVEFLVRLCKAHGGGLQMDSAHNDFYKARTMAQLSREQASELLEISEAEVVLFDTGHIQASPRQMRALEGYMLTCVERINGEHVAVLDKGGDSSETLDLRARKSALGQFFTPKPIADFMVNLFSSPSGNVKLLDAGAGEGALVSAFVERWGELLAVSHFEGRAFECDEKILPVLSSQLASLRDTRISAVPGDFIAWAASRILERVDVDFSHAILNPPYKKIGSSSLHRALVRSVGFETVNMYSAFVGVALEMLKNGGELVAIVPRSFCNGPYYLDFRKFILSKAAVEHIHIFSTRDVAFAKDNVLQENVILKLVKSKPQGTVKISTSMDHSFFDYKEFSFPFSDIVEADDQQIYIHVPTTGHGASRRYAGLSAKLEDLSVTCSTGPVVDFRVKSSLRADLTEGSVPLLYPLHFSEGRLNWPKVNCRKPNAIEVNCATKNSIWPSGHYTVVRRLSSKEERRRVFAAVYDPSKMTNTLVSFENHLNVFHNHKGPIDSLLAWGLAAYLNSTEVDHQMRSFSGHTQVNANDLRKLRYPSRQALQRFGKWYSETIDCDQSELDAQLDVVLR
jgi:adenine-specific DNA-methyltransferase